jgi:mitogen-activated protein kinase kinase
LNKIPNLRPTYAMLLQHAWLAPLVKPATIAEEDEEEEDEEAGGEVQAADNPSPRSPQTLSEPVFDQEVADWVKDALEKRKNGTLGKGAPKPALHAAPLDAVSSPGHNGTAALDLGVQAS